MSRLLVAVFALVCLASPATAQDDPKKQPPDTGGLKALKDPDPEVRYNAAQILIDVGPSGKFAVPAIQEQLKDEKVSWVKVKFIEAIWILDKPSTVKALLPPLLEIVKEDKSEMARASACNVIGLFGSSLAKSPLSKQAVTALMLALKDADATVRAEAAVALGEIGPAAKAAVPKLLETLKSDKLDFAEPFVLGALGKIGPDAGPALAEALGAPEYRLRRGAAYALALVRPPVKEAVQPLGKLLSAPESDLRGLAARALGKIGKDAMPLQTDVAKLLDDNNVQVRVQSAVALWEISGETSGKPMIVGALKSADQRVREQTCRVCAEIADAAVVPLTTLTDRLKDEAPSVRRLAAEALGLAGMRADASVPELRSALKDTDGSVRVSVALALWRIDKNAKEPVPLLTEWVANVDESVKTRKDAAGALATIGPDAKSAIKVLSQIRLDKTDNPEVRRAAAIALQKIGVQAQK
jgi:HEAT repeat protein